MPTSDWTNAWIELTTPLRVRKVPKQRQRERDRHQHHVPDLEHPLLLLHHHGVQERGGGQPRHQRGVLDGIPRPVAAPADLDVRPVRAQQHADAQARPREQRPAAARPPATGRRCGPRPARPSRTRTARPARRSPGTEPAGARPCTGSAATGRGRTRWPASRPGRGERRRHERAIAEKNTMIPPSTAVTHGISSRLRCRLVSITTVAAPPSTVSHSSSEPGWLAQNALSTYPVGSDRLVVSATIAIEKSWRQGRTAGRPATRVEPNDPITAFVALAVSRRSRRRPRTAPPPSRRPPARRRRAARRCRPWPN